VLTDAGVEFESMDSLYETSESFEEVYRRIAERLVEEATLGRSVAYAVPGHPSVGEKSVADLRALAAHEGVELTILPGVSFIDAVCTAVGADPAEGLVILNGVTLSGRGDAVAGEDEAGVREPARGGELCVRRGSPGEAGSSVRVAAHLHVPLLIGQVYSQMIASDVKLLLMEAYPEDHGVMVVQAAGVPGKERVERVPLFELDRLDWIDHLTSVYVPAVASQVPEEGDRGRWSRFPADRIVGIMSRLRGPGGCPWDRQQTPETLKPYLVEEAYEVVEAIDTGDPGKVCEELGDLLLQVVFHCQIASERGEFDFNDVVRGISEKLERRHPHVFGDVVAKDARAVLRNWERIKQEEKMDSGHDEGDYVSILAGIPKYLPALMQAFKLQDKAGRVGFDWARAEDAVLKVWEEVEEFREAFGAGDRARIREELGDLLFAIVNVARLLKVDPEEALRQTNSKFIRRFQFIEEVAAERGTRLEDMTLDQMDAIWNEAKARGL
jgi:tetrapyrrole methylase family protein/MazG family protein